MERITEEEYIAAQATVKRYERQLILDMVGNKNYYINRYALCWYKGRTQDPELYFCKVLSRDGEYVTAILYGGETFDENNIIGTFTDIFFSDLSWDKSAFNF